MVSVCAAACVCVIIRSFAQATTCVYARRFDDSSASTSVPPSYRSNVVTWLKFGFSVISPA